MKKNICIVHHNTPYMTECLIKSINKYTPDCHIYIFDNSDKEPFTYKQDNLIVFDNTQGQIINFDKWLDSFNDKNDDGTGKFISARHCISVDICMDLINEPFILLDSDVLIKKDISELFQKDKIFVGEIEQEHYYDGFRNMPRLFPTMCFINTTMCKEHGIRYFDSKFMLGLNNSHIKGIIYDTGSYFYYNSIELPYTLIKIYDYIIHYRSASWENWGVLENEMNIIHKDINVNSWLERHRIHWSNIKAKKICIVHYNTPYITEALIKSINLHVKDTFIYVFDNSDTQPFTNYAIQKTYTDSLIKFDNVEVFDNTQGQILNFENILKYYPKRHCDGLSNYGSFKHCLSVQKLIELIDDNFVLMDSDILIKKDFSNLYQEDKIFVGYIEKQGDEWMNRVCPYLCFLNNNMCKQYNINYYNDEYMFGLSEYQKNNMKYDTGAYFLEQTMNYEYLIKNIYEYMIHYHGASWKNDNVTLEQWLFQNQELWDNEYNLNEYKPNEYKPNEYKPTVSNKIIMTKAFKKEIQTRHKKINSIKRR